MKAKSKIPNPKPQQGRPPFPPRGGQRGDPAWDLGFEIWDFPPQGGLWR